MQDAEIEEVGNTEGGRNTEKVENTEGVEETEAAREAASVCPVWRERERKSGEPFSFPAFLAKLREMYPSNTPVTDGNDVVVPFKIPLQYTLPVGVEDRLKEVALEGTLFKPDLENWSSILECIDEHYELRVQGWIIGSSIYNYHCDYCGGPIFPSPYDEKGDFYYCDCCVKDMCPLCWSERSEAEAVKNGASRYKEREEALQKCFTQHPKHLLKRRVPTQFECDGCYAEISMPHYWYSGEWGKDEELIDLCEKCWNLSSTVELDENDAKRACIGSAKRAAQLRAKHQIVAHETPRLTAERLRNLYPFFPSTADWVPFAEDGEDNYLISNCNPQSPQFGLVGFLLSDESSFLFQYVTDDLRSLLQKVRTTRGEHEDVAEKDGFIPELIQLVAENRYGIKF